MHPPIVHVPSWPAGTRVFGNSTATARSTAPPKVQSYQKKNHPTCPYSYQYRRAARARTGSNKLNSRPNTTHGQGKEPGEWRGLDRHGEIPAARRCPAAQRVWCDCHLVMTRHGQAGTTWRRSALASTGPALLGVAPYGYSCLVTFTRSFLPPYLDTVG